MTSGRVLTIHIAPEQGGPIEDTTAVDAVARRGLEGDRYFRDDGTFTGREGCDLTLIESEALAAVEDDYEISLDAGAHRRNVTTAGVALNHLVDQEFRVGEAVCRGIELCEPCSYLESHLERRGIRDALVHRGGLRAQILEGGEIEVGDAVEPVLK